MSGDVTIFRCSPGRCHDDNSAVCKSSAGSCFYESKADGTDGYIVTQAGCIEIGIESDAFICSETGSAFKVALTLIICCVAPLKLMTQSIK